MNSNIDYERNDGLGLAGFVKDGSVSAAELLEAAIERVEQRNPAINAVIDRMYDQAKAAIAPGLPAGPFSSVPYLLKDGGASYAGTVTTLGSSAFRKFIPDQDSEIVVRLKQAGLVIFGKTHIPEFGLSSSSESRQNWPYGRLSRRRYSCTRGRPWVRITSGEARH